MNFTETIQWVGVIKPVNTDFNVAEKTTLTFLKPHGFIVGDYITEIIGGAAKGIVYEVPDTLTVNVAKQDENAFPETGEVTNGAITITYVSRTISHGINNQVIQDLVDRTAYNKKRIDDLELSVGNIDNSINNIDNSINNIDNSINNIISDITILQDTQTDLKYEIVTTSTVAQSNKHYICNLISENITITLPEDANSGDWVSVFVGGNQLILTKTVSVYFGNKYFNTTLGPNATIQIDIPYKFITFSYTSNSWYITC